MKKNQANPDTLPLEFFKTGLLHVGSSQNREPPKIGRFGFGFKPTANKGQKPATTMRSRAPAGARARQQAPRQNQGWRAQCRLCGPSHLRRTLPSRAAHAVRKNGARFLGGLSFFELVSHVLWLSRKTWGCFVGYPDFGVQWKPKGKPPFWGGRNPFWLV